MSTHDRVAVELPVKLWRSASNAANSMVESSDTRKTALLAIQKAGHGDAVRAGVAELTDVGEDWAVVISARRRIVGLPRGQWNLHD